MPGDKRPESAGFCATLTNTDICFNSNRALPQVPRWRLPVDDWRAFFKLCLKCLTCVVIDMNARCAKTAFITTPPAVSALLAGTLPLAQRVL